jgi:hypothetical protein
MNTGVHNSSIVHHGSAPGGGGEAGRLGPGIWRISAVAVIGSFMAQLDATMVNVSLSSLGMELHASLSAIQWVTSGYLLALALMLALSGWLPPSLRHSFVASDDASFSRRFVDRNSSMPNPPIVLAHCKRTPQSITSEAAIRDWFRARYDRTANVPLFPGIFPGQLAPMVRTRRDGERSAWR